MVLTALFVIAAAAPTAFTIDFVAAFAGQRVASVVEARRVTRLLAKIRVDMALVRANEAHIDAWVAEACSPELNDPLDTVVVGGQPLRMSAKQFAFLEEALDDEDDRRLRPLLTKVLLQTQEYAARQAA